MPCTACAERRERMKAWLKLKAEQAAKWAKVRGNADTTTGVQTRKATRTTAPAQGSGQAGTASAEHQQRRVEADTHVGTEPGRVSVQGVRKAGRRKTGTR